MQGIATLLAAHGRNGDTYMVHAAKGETLVPVEVLDANPNLRMGIYQALAAAGADPERYVVGSKSNSINPITGAPEFFFSGIKDIFKTAAPVLGAIAGSFIPGLGPVIGPALGSFAGSKLAGNSTRSALIGAGIAGLGGYLASGTGAAQAGGYRDSGNFLGIGGDGPTLGSSLWNGISSNGIGSLFSSAPAATGGVGASSDILTGSAGTDSLSGSTAAAPAQIANSTGTAGTVTQAAAPIAAKGAPAATSFLGGIGNWVKENPLMATALGVGGLYLAGGFDPKKPDFKQDPRWDGRDGPTLLAQDPGKYGFTDTRAFFPSGRGLPKYYNDGGHVAGPGGPKEDKIPAMLSDGEFVMTADAVRGLGMGDRIAGAKRMYQLMKQLEHTASPEQLRNAQPMNSPGSYDPRSYDTTLENLR